MAQDSTPVPLERGRSIVIGAIVILAVLIVVGLAVLGGTSRLDAATIEELV